MTPQMHHVDNSLPFVLTDSEYTMKALSPQDLKEAFPEALSIIKKNLNAYKKRYKEIEPIYNELLDIFIEAIYANDEIPDEKKDERINEANRILYRRPLIALERNIKRLSHLLALFEYKGNDSAQTITPTDIDQAKNFPIRNFYEPNRAGFILCPFHSESTPSCKIFEDNKFRCFGCGANGDVLDLTMKQFNLPFLEAVRKILNK